MGESGAILRRGIVEWSQASRRRARRVVPSVLQTNPNEDSPECGLDNAPGSSPTPPSYARADVRRENDLRDVTGGLSERGIQIPGGLQSSGSRGNSPWPAILFYGNLTSSHYVFRPFESSEGAVTTQEQHVRKVKTTLDYFRGVMSCLERSEMRIVGGGILR